MDPSDDTSPTPTLEPPLNGIGGNNHEDGLLAAPLLSFILDLLVDPESTITIGQSPIPRLTTRSSRDLGCVKDFMNPWKYSNDT